MKRTITSLESPRGGWDKATVVAALRSRRDNGLGTGIGAIQKSQPGLSSAIYRLFGSHDHALSAARVGPERRGRPAIWDRSAVIAALRSRRDKGLGTGSVAIRQSQHGLSSAIYRLFGSHSHALSAAGMDPEWRGRPAAWDHSTVVAALRSRRDKGLGTDIGAIQKSQPGLSSAIYRLFGSHSHALSAAGLDPARKRRAGAWDQCAVLAGLRRRQSSGKPLSS